ncbi:MAG TPA: hypothetical protein VLK22_01320 [Candidatus Udaeobacter sp.]|nr:hypothetical protein [Candidatus Udaeobacter sp.]
MNKKSCLWILILIIISIILAYLYNNNYGSSQGHKKSNILPSGFLIERTDGFAFSTIFPANSTATELFGFTFHNNLPPYPHTSSTQDASVKSLRLRISTSSTTSTVSSLSVINSHIRRLKLVSDGVVLGIWSHFTTTTFDFNNLLLAIPSGQSKELRLLADTFPTSTDHGILQFKIFRVNAENNNGDLLQVIRIPDGFVLSAALPLTSTVFHF